MTVLGEGELIEAPHGIRTKHKNMLHPLVVRNRIKVSNRIGMGHHQGLPRMSAGHMIKAPHSLGAGHRVKASRCWEINIGSRIPADWAMDFGSGINSVKVLGMGPQFPSDWV